MAASWFLHAIYASLLGQSVINPDKPLNDPSSFVTTKTTYGDLRGIRKLTATTNVLVDSYLGIPFALPPVGQMRFDKPERPLRWNGLRDALRFGNECHQRNFPGYAPYKVEEEPVGQSEDCLYLNVYVPSDAKTGNPLAVMVWIHGGGYYLGAGSQYDGSELAATGVIVVTINYRLDIFGFLSNEDEEIPGNFGMLDQIMALRWVKESISSFGGDPNKVTVFGESAGSASVSLLILSPLAKGLFHRAIMSTGVSLSPWAITLDTTRLTPRLVLALIGDRIGCTDSSVSRKLQCFRSVEAKDLFNASESVQNIFYSRILFAPRVENTFSFLPDLPINLFKKNDFNHVDTIHGNPTDGFGSNVFYLGINFTSRDGFLKVFKQALEPYAFTGRDLLVNEIANDYLETNATGNIAIKVAVVKAVSDFLFLASTIAEANFHSTYAGDHRHYVYEFRYKPSFSSLPSWLHAVHGDDIPFIFGVNLPEFQPYVKEATGNDNRVWNQMKTLWSNFAKHGDPNGIVPKDIKSWLPYSAENGMYLRIDDQSEMVQFNDNKAVEMYDALIQKLQTAREK